MGSRKTGIPTLMQVGKRMCDLLNRFAPVIELLYPDNAVLIAALAAAKTACEALDVELAKVRDYGD